MTGPLITADNTALSENYMRAMSLNARIITCAQMAQQNLVEACRGLKEMKDTGLYSELGYESFEEYTETEVGIKSRQAYRYISIIENLPENFVSPGTKLGASKLYLLSTLSEEERTEVTESVDLETVSKRELEKKVKEIKTLRHDLEKANEDNDELNERLSNLENEKQLTLESNEKLQKELDSTSRENAELSKRIDELENRPVEVAVESNDEELEKMRQTAEKEKSEIHEQYKAKIEELTVEYEAKLSEAEKNATTEAVPDAKETFKLYYTMAYNAFGTLVKFVKQQDDDSKKVFIEKVLKLADSLKESAENV